MRREHRVCPAGFATLVLHSAETEVCSWVSRPQGRHDDLHLSEGYTMSTAPVSVVPGQAPFTPSGEALTRRAVTTVTAAVMVITFAFSLGNVTRLSLDLGITVWIAWLVGPAVDLSVIGLLVGIRFCPCTVVRTASWPGCGACCASAAS
jgi:hypothetical protein